MDTPVIDSPWRRAPAGSSLSSSHNDRVHCFTPGIEEAKPEKNCDGVFEKSVAKYT